MGAKTSIEWTRGADGTAGATWTPIRARNRVTGKVGWHCEHVTPGCEHCYSETLNIRLGTGLPFKPGHRADVEVFLDPKMLLQPLRWTRPRMIFVCSMTDLFADFVTDDMIDQVFAVMALCPQHTFQVLTKRSARMRHYLSHIGNRDDLIADHAVSACLAKIGAAEGVRKSVMFGVRSPLPNVWLGVSAEDQRRADERVPDLLATPAAVRFVSAEPLLGPIDFCKVRPDLTMAVNALTGAAEHLLGFRDRAAHLDWIIVGGESGPGARPMHPDWVRSILDQCAAAGTAFFFKQWGEYQADQIGPEDTRSLHHSPGHVIFNRVGKKAAGRRFEGVEHNGMPGARS